MLHYTYRGSQTFVSEEISRRRAGILHTQTPLRAAKDPSVVALSSTVLSGGKEDGLGKVSAGGWASESSSSSDVGHCELSFMQKPRPSEVSSDIHSQVRAGRQDCIMVTTCTCSPHPRFVSLALGRLKLVEQQPPWTLLAL